MVKAKCNFTQCKKNITGVCVAKDIEIFNKECKSFIDEKLCRIKDCNLNKKGHCEFKKGFSVIQILNCPRGYGKR